MKKTNKQPLVLVLEINEVLKALQFIHGYCEQDDKLDTKKEIEQFKTAQIKRLLEKYGNSNKKFINDEIKKGIKELCN